MHLSLDVVTVFYFPENLICIVTTIWRWYSWYWSLILSRWVAYYLALTLINKINQVGVTGGDCSRGNAGRCAWKGPLVGLDATRDLVIYARFCYYILHDTWVQWAVSPYYQDPLTHHLFDMWLSCGMGHRMDALVRVIKHTRLKIIICDMDNLDYMIFLDFPYCS